KTVLTEDGCRRLRRIHSRPKLVELQSAAKNWRRILQRTWRELRCVPLLNYGRGWRISFKMECKQTLCLYRKLDLIQAVFLVVSVDADRPSHCESFRARG